MWNPIDKKAIEKQKLIVDLFTNGGKTVIEIKDMLNIKTRGQVYKYLWSAGVPRRKYKTLYKSS